MTTDLVPLYTSDAVVAVNKPAGVATHPSRGTGSVPSALSLVKQLIGGWVQPVHRLDQATSGVLLFARDQTTARELMAMFARREVKKTYLAIVRGHLPDHGVIDRDLLDEATGQKKPAVTHYVTLGRAEFDWAIGRYPSARYSLVSLAPETGRRHQLRRHLDSISHPIIGDTRYGNGAHNRAFRERLGYWRMMLHATRLELELPDEPGRVAIAAPLDGEFAAARELFS